MLLLAGLVFAVLTGAAAWAEWRLRHNGQPDPMQLWLDWFLLPFARVVCLLGFIALAGASLYGARGPGLAELLAEAPGRMDRLINWLFFTGLLLPAIPLLRRTPGLVLPLQGGTGVALVFTWLAATREVEPMLLPTPGLFLLLATMSALAMTCSHLLSQAVEDELLRQEVYDLLLLWLQLPLLVVYGQWLGRQLV